jgi:hypothetical protein
VGQASVDGDLAVIHSKLNDSEFARSWEEGRNMAVDEAVALALKE